MAISCIIATASGKLWNCTWNINLNLQEDAIQLILEGQHVVLNIATGGGKSLPQITANIFAQGNQVFKEDEEFVPLYVMIISPIWTHHKLQIALNHTSYLSQTPQTCLYKNLLSGVNFYRLSEKMHIFDFFRNIFRVFGAFSRFFVSVKFGFRKSCQCKRNVKYEVYSWR